MQARAVAYVDLDGVLADFVGAALRAHGASLVPSEIRWDFCSQIGFAGPADPLFWEPLGKSFWESLDQTAEGPALLRAVEALFGERVALVSSPARTPGCDEGKRAWVAKHLPAYADRLFLGKAKHLLAAPGKVLLDDHEANVDAFTAEGGRGVLVPRPWNRYRGETDTNGHFDVRLLIGDICRALQSHATACVAGL